MGHANIRVSVLFHHNNSHINIHAFVFVCQHSSVSESYFIKHGPCQHSSVSTISSKHGSCQHLNMCNISSLHRSCQHSSVLIIFHQNMGHVNSQALESSYFVKTRVMSVIKRVYNISSKTLAMSTIKRVNNIS